MAIFKKKQEVDEVVAAPVEEAPAKRAKKAVSPLALRTIIAPLASEKTAGLADDGVYVFLVAKGANRVAVRQAIRELYHVTPIKVNVINVRGKQKRFGRGAGRRADIKKALVTLPKGSRIDLFDTV